MIATWMLYGVLISAMLGAAALAAESIMRCYARPGRWVWAAAMVGSIALPITALLGPLLVSHLSYNELGAGPPRIPLTDWSLLRTTLDGAVALLDPLSPLLAGLWVLGSVTLLAVVSWSNTRLVRDRRGWRPAVVGSVPVLVSHDAGPAVVGVVRSNIVLPEWVLSLGSEVQSLIAQHEEQHRVAGDVRLLVSALVIVLLLPWNVPLWWQFRRLRLAVEADCDQRVLESGADVGTYGALLIKMGQRARRPLAALAFSPRRSSLSRRIALMTWKPRFRLGRAIAAASLGVALVFGACETPSPQGPTMNDQMVTDGLVEGELACGSIAGRDCSAKPLYILDGVVVTDRSLVDLQVIHIDRVEVIKGPAARERYGDRAASGVVSIFTKRQTTESTAHESIEAGDSTIHIRRINLLKASAESLLQKADSDAGVLNRH